MTAPTLALDGATVRFGGLIAIDDLSIAFGGSPISCLIGPNGAGKTTVFNVLSGVVRPMSGTVRLGDLDITGISPHRAARMGIVRKFQVPTVFAGLSVSDNLRVAVDAPRRASLPSDGQRWTTGEVAAMVGLESKLSLVADELSHGQRQWLEIGMAVLRRPLYLLLDEPAAGLGPEETKSTARLIKDISETCSVVVIEHDMHFIRELESEVTVLHQGRFLAHGTMREIEGNAVVRDVYLGRDAHA